MLCRKRRKELGFEFTDRIDVTCLTASTELEQAVSGFLDYIKSETLCVELGFETPSAPRGAGEHNNVKQREVEIVGESVTFFVRAANG